MKVILAFSLSQLLDLLVVQLASDDVFQLFFADLHIRFLFLCSLVTRLEARLHADAESGIEGDVICVSTHFRPAFR